MHCRKGGESRTIIGPGWSISSLPAMNNIPVFKTASVVRATDVKRMLQVSLVSISRRQEVDASPEKKNRGEHVRTRRGQGTSEVNWNPALPTIVLEAFPSAMRTDSAGTEDHTPAAPTSQNPETLPVGTKCKSSAPWRSERVEKPRGRRGSSAPVGTGSFGFEVVLPAGSLFQGKVMKEMRPRWLSRPVHCI